MLTDTRSSPAEYDHLSDTSLYTLEIGAGSFVPLQKSHRNHRSYVWSEALFAAWFSLRRKSYPAYSLRASSPIWASEASLARKRERGPSRLRRSLARSRETRFASPNRRACSQAIRHSLNIVLHYNCITFGGSLCTTRSTSGISSPLAATSVATKQRTFPSRKLCQVNKIW